MCYIFMGGGDMRLATVRDFKIQATKYLGMSDEVVITRRGRPIAVLTPVKAKSTGALLLSLRGILQEAGISKGEALKVLEQVRAEVYG